MEVDLDASTVDINYSPYVLDMTCISSSSKYKVFVSNICMRHIM